MTNEELRTKIEEMLQKNTKSMEEGIAVARDVVHDLFQIYLKKKIKTEKQQ